MATQAQIESWTDTVSARMRSAKESGRKQTPLIFAYQAIRGSGITHDPDVKRLGKDVLQCLQARSARARRRQERPRHSAEEIARANIYQ